MKEVNEAGATLLRRFGCRTTRVFAEAGTLPVSAGGRSSGHAVSLMLALQWAPRCNRQRPRRRRVFLAGCVPPMVREDENANDHAGELALEPTMKSLRNTLDLLGPPISIVRQSSRSAGLLPTMGRSS